jgi:hypothetical protein
MRCIFCKKESSESKSIEHIIPESLGNTRVILPPGRVCDKCNNYFSRKIEGKLLELTYFKNLRFRQDIKSKKGRSPIENGIYLTQNGEIKVKIDRNTKNPQISEVRVNTEDWQKMLNSPPTALIFREPDLPERNNRIISRWLGKVGIELLASDPVPEKDLNEFVIDNTDFDLLRNFVRYGKLNMDWPYHLRRIYPENNSYQIYGEKGQMIHEERLLFTDSRELYVVVCVMGVEYSLNMVGPDFDGYEIWLKEHDYDSPLDEKYCKERWEPIYRNKKILQT